jgi:lysozyme
MHTISEFGLNTIKKFEGLRLEAYQCPAGVYTIGYGSTRFPDGSCVCMYDKLHAEAEATELLKYTVQAYEQCINDALPNLNQNQFDALVSFTYNIGIGAFLASTLLKLAKVNAQDPRIRNEFLRWNIAGGKILAGLQTRRSEEARLYFSLNNSSI